MAQIQRIRHMERQLDSLVAATKAMDKALCRFAGAQKAAQELDSYYGSHEWRQDLQADEAGLLPAKLKRGVLSEDSAWNALADYRDTLRRMADMTENTKQ